MMFKKMPFILLAMIAMLVILEQFMTIEIKSMLYATSLSIKAVIAFLLPFIIFVLLFKTIIELGKGATKIILLVVLVVCISNLLSTQISQLIGLLVYGMKLHLILPNEQHTLEPYWTFNLPIILANNVAMGLGCITGLLASFSKSERITKFTIVLELIISKILNSFTYLIPIFVAGFIVKLQFDGVMGVIIRDYSLIFAIVALAQFSYIALIYFLSSTNFLLSIKNMLPAAVVAFSSMSSLAALPLTMVGTEKNSSNPDLARSIIPATVNIHLIGDCFAIPIFAYAVLKNYGIAAPGMAEYLIFTFYFMVTKFSVAAIPGGGIIVMIPILEHYLGFKPEMLSLITALYILFDPVITCANVMGNGGFSMVFSKLYGKGKQEL